MFIRRFRHEQFAEINDINTKKLVRMTRVITEIK